VTGVQTCALPIWPFDERQFGDLKRGYVYRAQIPAAFPDELLGSCHGVAAQALAGTGMQARYWGYGGKPLNLSEDLCRLLWGGLNLSAGNLPPSANAQTQLLFFENWMQAAQARTVTHMAQLARHAAAENDLWP
jgi:hypothetical protein